MEGPRPVRAAPVKGPSFGRDCGRPSLAPGGGRDERQRPTAAATVFLAVVEQQDDPPQQSHGSPALAGASHEQSGQVQASPQQSQPAFATFAVSAPFSTAGFVQQAFSALADFSTLVALAAGQQAAPTQQSQAWPATSALASQVQAVHSQAGPQQAHAALSFVLRSRA